MLDWKNIAVDSLKIFRPMEIALVNIPCEIQEIKWDMGKTEKAVIDGLQVDSVKDIQLSRRIMIRKLEHRLESTHAAVEATKQALAMLTQEEKRILSDFFISNTGKRMEDIAQDLGYSLATMYRKKDAALWNYAVNLHGIDMDE